MNKLHKGDKVKIHYTTMLKDGSVIETSSHYKPMKFTIGEKEVFSVIEETVKSMDVGDKRRVEIPAEKAFGVHRDDLVLDIGRDEVEAEREPRVGQPAVLRFKNNSRKKKRLRGIIVDIINDRLIFNANHPLAGKDLVVDIELLEVS